MNAATNNAAVSSVEVLCRFDPAKNKPVVFVATNMEGDNIQSWIAGDAVMSPLSYYHSTLPLSAADETLLANRYARHFHIKHVLVRHRLPRTARMVPNRIAANKAPVAAVAPAGGSVVVPLTPAAVVSGDAVASVAPAIKRKTAAKKTAKRGRKPAAKPIDAQAPTPAAPPVDASPTLEQKVDQLALLFSQLLEKVSLPAGQ